MATDLEEVKAPFGKQPSKCLAGNVIFPFLFFLFCLAKHALDPFTYVPLPMHSLPFIGRHVTSTFKCSNFQTMMQAIIKHISPIWNQNQRKISGSLGSIHILESHKSTPFRLFQCPKWPKSKRVKILKIQKLDYKTEFKMVFHLSVDKVVLSIANYSYLSFPFFSVTAVLLGINYIK